MGSLLLLLVVLLLLRLPTTLIIPPHSTNQTATDSADRRSLAGIASDRANTESDQTSAQRAAADAALLRFRLRRWRPTSHLLVGRIKSTLLNCPNVAVAMISVLLLLCLALRRVDKRLLRLRDRNACGEGANRQNQSAASQEHGSFCGADNCFSEH